MPLKSAERLEPASPGASRQSSWDLATSDPVRNPVTLATSERGDSVDAVCDLRSATPCVAGQEVDDVMTSRSNRACTQQSWGESLPVKSELRPTHLTTQSEQRTLRDLELDRRVCGNVA